MKSQEIFDTVYNGLLAQGEPAVDEYGCKFRVEIEGVILKCAVGFFIPDDRYREELETQSIDEGSELDALLKEVHGITSQHQIGLLQELQGAHDSTLWHHGMEDWKERMQEIAKAHHLKMPTV